MNNIESYMSKYKNFMAPEYSVTINGEKCTGKLNISNISVDLGMGERANGCRFTLVNVYNYKTHSVTSDIQSKIVLGNVVKVSLGYASQLSPIFTGFIESLDYSYDAGDGMSIDVTCLDARALMKESAKREMNKDKPIGELLNNIFKDYKPMIKNFKSSVEKFEFDQHVQIKMTDFDFVMWIADERNKYFYIIDSSAYIADKESKVAFAYDFNNTLFSLDFSMSYLDKKYEGIANEKQGKASFTVNSEAKQIGAQKSPIQKKIKEINKLRETNQKDAEKRNKVRADEAQRESQTGSITSVGIPDISPGKNIQIENFPIKAISNNNKFFVTSVRHTIDSNGYTTNANFNLGV